MPFANFMSSTNDGWIMNLVLGMMYLVFPTFWVGINLGTIVQTGLEKAESPPQDAGAKAGRDAQGLVTDKKRRGLKVG